MTLHIFARYVIKKDLALHLYFLGKYESLNCIVGKVLPNTKKINIAEIKSNVRLWGPLFFSPM